MRRHCGPKCENMGSVIDWKEVFQGMLGTFFGDRNVLYVGTSRVVQWLKLCLPMQRARVLSLVGKLRAHKLLNVAKFFFLKNSECVMGGEEHPLFSSTEIFSMLYCSVVTVYTVAKTHWNCTFKICLFVTVNKNKIFKILNLSTIYGLFQRKWNTWVIYLTKCVQVLYVENYKMLMRKIKDLKK